MPAAVKRTQVWLTTLGDWSWPGARQAGEMLPPAWVPAMPPALEPAVPAGHLRVGGDASGVPRRRIVARRLGLAGVAGALAAAAAVLALGGPRALERLAGQAGTSPSPTAATAASAAPGDAAPLPALVPVSSGAAGSAVDHTNFHSQAIGRGGSFYVYLPPGFAATTQRYPVVYLLPGYKQRASAFLHMGVQRTLDRLIARGEVPPMVAVMIQGGPGAAGWKGIRMPRYEAYVLEVQTLIDRMLPTIPQRNARAIAGASMGGYGAMNIALGNPYRFGVVESWLAFFNGLEQKLRAARPVIAALGLHAFVYGAAGDRIADPSQNRPFAAALRAAGADARGAVYAGEHRVQTVEDHLSRSLAFAGRSLAAAARAAGPAGS